jgi:beta-galactosidase
MKKYLIIVILIILFTGLNVKSQDVNSFFPEKELITTGIYYYPEHWDEIQWERDINKMSDMGFEFVHLAEFAWFKMEPEEGRFEFSWLDKVVNLCNKYNLKVVMCTPSATTPTWMRAVDSSRIIHYQGNNKWADVNSWMDWDIPELKMITNWKG